MIVPKQEERMWNVWDLSFGQSLSAAFMVGGIVYFMIKVIERLGRISTALEAIANQLRRTENR